MKSLTELASDLVGTTNKIIENEGELSLALEAELECVSSQLATKADHYAFRIEKLEKLSEMWEERERRAYQAKKVLRDHVKNLKDRIKFVMKELDTNEIYGEEIIWRLRPSVAKLSVNEELLPNSWKTRIEEWKPDNKRIKEALTKGEEIPGAQIEHGSTLTKATNTESKKIGS